jgi:hypothetical protein
MSEAMAFKVAVVLSLAMMYGVCFATVEEDTLAELVVLNNTMQAVQQYLVSTLDMVGGTYDATLSQLVKGGLFAGTQPNVPFLQLIYERMNEWDQNDLPQILGAIYGLDSAMLEANVTLDGMAIDLGSIDFTAEQIDATLDFYLPELVTISARLATIDAAIDQQYPALSGIWQGMDLANTRLATVRDTLLLMEPDLDAIARDMKWLVGDDPAFGAPDSWQIDGNHDSLREYLDHQVDAMERIDSRLVYVDPETSEEWSAAELLAMIAMEAPEGGPDPTEPFGTGSVPYESVDYTGAPYYFNDDQARQEMLAQAEALGMESELSTIEPDIPTWEHADASSAPSVNFSMSADLLGVGAPGTLSQGLDFSWYQSSGIRGIVHAATIALFTLGMIIKTFGEFKAA